jgi:energy-coupling factor transporter ATP-binding protein EcfA2
VCNLGCFGKDWHSIDFTQETLLAGPNNSGKSMFLACINLIRHDRFNMFSWATSMYNFVSFGDCVHNHDVDKVISASLKLKEGIQEIVFTLETSRRHHSVGVKSTPVIPQGDKDQIVREILKKIWYLHPHRSPIQHSSMVQPTSGPLQPLNPNGSNVINFMLERWTDRDKRWSVAEEWLAKIDPRLSEIKTPIKGNVASLETMYGTVPVNMSLQGSGFQSAAAIIAALVFSPEGSTIIIEEPEVFLHPNSQEILVDLMNDVVNKENKQVIFSTHSCNILLPFFSDVSHYGAQRGEHHPRANREKFSMWTFENVEDDVEITHYDLDSKTFQQFRTDFKQVWG